MCRRKAVLPEIKWTANLIERYMFHEKEKSGLPDLNGQQMHILGYINKQYEDGNDVFQRNIETILNVRPSTATNIIKVLEKNGYITRESVASDARLKKLVLTDKANGTMALAFSTIKEAETRITDGISPEDLATFFKVIDKMKSNLCVKLDTNNKHH